MHVLISLARFMLGGTETYSVTVAEQLERLGHTVTVHATEASPEGRELLSAHGLRLIVGDPGEFDSVDAVLAQDAANAYMLAERRPELRQVFAAHGVTAFEQAPTWQHGSPTVVVFNDRIAGRAAAQASRPPIVRLRQPIDLEQFRPRGAGRTRARRVLLLSNYLDAARSRLLEDVCDDLGLELVRIGASSGSLEIGPQAALAEADIVVGYGRSILEGMAMGRAAYVWDYAGGDGWVTPETYAAIEADGFSGAGSDDVIDGDRLRADFAAYDPELGAFGFDLVRMHHSAAKHSEDLVDLLDRAGAPGPGEAMETLGRLVRLEFRAVVRTGQLEFENWRMREERDVERARRIESEEQMKTMMGSRSWKLTAAMRRAGASLRRHR
jgi:hypothetical protein